MKKRIFTAIAVCVSLVLTFACGVSGCGDKKSDMRQPGITDSDSGDTGAQQPDVPSGGESGVPAGSESETALPRLGVWWWSDSLGDEYLDFAKDNGVTEIYFCSSKFNDKTDEFIKKCNDNGMDVYWLAGEYQWVENYSSVKKQIDKYVKYQDTYGNRFCGIHFDIEPHQHPEFRSGRRAELLTKYVELTAELKSSYPDIRIEYDIPFWLDDEITVGGETKAAYKWVMDNASRVTLMSYRDTAEKIYKVSEEEIAYAKETGKSLNLGVETKSSEGDQVSFMEEGKNVMYEEISKLRGMIPGDYGVVIHQIKQWYDLKD